MTDMMMTYVLLIVVWASNINDLIRGHWFYDGWEGVVFWNLIGIVAMLHIIIRAREDRRTMKNAIKNNRHIHH